MLQIPYYQTIPKLGIKGRINTPAEFARIGLPEQLFGKEVLDIGCNQAAYLIECADRGAMLVVGVEPDHNWRWLAWGCLMETKNPQTDCVVYETVPVTGEYDLVLLLSVTHVAEGMTGQEAIDIAYTHTKKDGLLIVEINDRLQKEKVTLPGKVSVFGKAKDDRTVYHIKKP